MVVTVDADALTSAATGLAGASPCAGAVCEPAAADPVSVWIATVINTASAAVSALLAHAGAQRAAGGASLTVTAHTVQVTDQANAQAVTAGQPSGLGAVMPNVLAALPAPSLPSIPVVPPAAPLPGELISTLVHAGPGPESLRSMASQLRATAGQVSSLASDTRRYGALVDTHWQDGQQQAGTNIAAHAQWLDGVQGHLIVLAGGVEQAAGHVDNLIQQVPRPEEFAQAKQRVTEAMQQFRASGGLNPAPVTAAVTQLADKQTQALGAQETYHAATAATAAGLPSAPIPAPPIVKGDHPVGDKPGGKKKPGTPDGKNPASPPDPLVAAAPAVVAQIAGTALGAGTGVVGQLAQGVQGLVSAPMEALSSLTSSLGGGHDAIQAHSLGLDHSLGGGPDLGGSDTGGGGGGADPGGSGTVPATAGPVPGAAVSAVPVSAAGVVAGGMPTQTPVSGTGGPGMGGMGMMPPMMGMGGRQGERQRDGQDQRVVLRPTPNSEPVFGELERRPRRTRPKDNHETGEQP